MNALVLVNLQHGIPMGMEQDLIPVHKDYPEILMEREAAEALSRLMEKMDGWKYIVPVSGWRSMEEQQTIYDDSLRDTGLAIDLGLRQKEIDFIRPAFPYDGICQTFRELAPAYGFIERYPAGKEAITGIAHEPWHFRYVGTPHAEAVTKAGLTLEEYLK